MADTDPEALAKVIGMRTDCVALAPIAVHRTIVRPDEGVVRGPDRQSFPRLRIDLPAACKSGLDSPYVPVLFSPSCRSIHRFLELSDGELSEVLHEAISRGGTGLSRLADTFVATLCADYLVTRMREARLVVYKAGPAPDGSA
jgi:hypothetical protein